MLTNYVNNLSNLVNQFVPIYQTILDTINNPNEISNIYQLLDNITEELNASGNECELEFMANNKFILTTYTGNGNCIINVLPGGANINCSVVYVALQIYFIPIHIIFINNLPLAKGVFFFWLKTGKKITCKIAGY